MKVQAATISLAGINFAVVVVAMDLIKNPGEADMAIDRFSPGFGGVPVILLAQNDSGIPTYYGDQEIIQLLKEVSISQIPWKEYSVT